jgi:hypothetical protein
MYGPAGFGSRGFTRTRPPRRENEINTAICQCARQIIFRFSWKGSIHGRCMWHKPPTNTYSLARGPTGNGKPWMAWYIIRPRSLAFGRTCFATTRETFFFFLESRSQKQGTLFFSLSHADAGTPPIPPGPRARRYVARRPGWAAYGTPHARPHVRVGWRCGAGQQGRAGQDRRITRLGVRHGWGGRRPRSPVGARAYLGVVWCVPCRLVVGQFRP